MISMRPYKHSERTSQDSVVFILLNPEIKGEFEYEFLDQMLTFEFEPFLVCSGSTARCTQYFNDKARGLKLLNAKKYRDQGIDVIQVIPFEGDLISQKFQSDRIAKLLRGVIGRENLLNLSKF